MNVNVDCYNRSKMERLWYTCKVRWKQSPDPFVGNCPSLIATDSGTVFFFRNSAYDMRLSALGRRTSDPEMAILLAMGYLPSYIFTIKKSVSPL
jgi:hypothetical protein